MRGRYILLMVLLCAGCVTNFSLNDSQAAMIARQECEARDRWMETTCNARREKGVWNVLVHRVTGRDEQGNAVFAPGESRLVVIDGAGKVLSYRTP